MAVFPSAVQKSCVLAKHFLSITELFHGDYRLVFSGNYICLSFIYICVCVCVYFKAMVLFSWVPESLWTMDTGSTPGLGRSHMPGSN